MMNFQNFDLQFLVSSSITKALKQEKGLLAEAHNPFFFLDLLHNLRCLGNVRFAL